MGWRISTLILNRLPLGLHVQVEQKNFQGQHSAVEYLRSEMSLKSEHLLTELRKANEPPMVLKAIVFISVPKYRLKNLMSGIITYWNRPLHLDVNSI